MRVVEIRLAEILHWGFFLKSHFNEKNFKDKKAHHQQSFQFGVLATTIILHTLAAPVMKY